MIYEKPVGNLIGTFLGDIVARMLAKPDESPIEIITGKDPSILAEPETLTLTRVRHADRLSGLDVSHHQGGVAWRRVVEAGHSFAIIKSTEGGTDSRGRGYVDRRFAENVEQARAAGLPALGSYHFGTWYNMDPKSPNLDAINEAEHHFKTLEDHDALGPGFLPPILDLEGDRREPHNHKLEDGPIIEWAMQYQERIEELSGRLPWMYTGYWFDLRLGQPKEFRKFPLWLARYNGGHEPTRAPLDWPWAIWQYTGKGKTKGIQDSVDLNWFAGTGEDLRALALLSSAKLDSAA